MKRFNNILYVVGSGSNEETAFKRAIDLADSNQAKLTIIGVFDDINRLKSSMPIVKDLIDGIIDQKKQEIKVLVNSIQKNNLEIEIKVFTGKAFIDIIQEVIKHKRDLLIKAIEQPDSFIETLFGNTDIKILRKCPCPVWLIKAKAQDGYKKILVGLSYEPDNPEIEVINNQLLTMAGSLALAEFSELHIVHAWQLQYESILRSSRSTYSSFEIDEMLKAEELTHKKWLKQSIAKSMDALDSEASSYLKPKLHLLEGNASKIVPELAQEIGVELMVMSTVGRSGIAGYLIGNTAETILNQINCSVLAIKPQNFVSPIKI